jgi:hypothetical protein
MVNHVRKCFSFRSSLFSLYTYITYMFGFFLSFLVFHLFICIIADGIRSHHPLDISYRCVIGNPMHIADDCSWINEIYREYNVIRSCSYLTISKFNAYNESIRIYMMVISIYYEIVIIQKSFLLLTIHFNGEHG